MKNRLLRKFSAAVAAGAVAVVGAFSAMPHAHAAQEYASPQEAGLNLEITKLENANTGEVIPVGSTIDFPPPESGGYRVTLRLSSSALTLNGGDSFFVTMESAPSSDGATWVGALFRDVPAEIVDDRTGEVLFTANTVLGDSKRILFQATNKVNNRATLDLEVSVVVSGSNGACLNSASGDESRLHNVTINGVQPFTANVLHKKCTGTNTTEDLKASALQGNGLPFSDIYLNKSDKASSVQKFSQLLREYFYGDLSADDPRVTKDVVMVRKETYPDGAVPSSCSVNPYVYYAFQFLNTDADGEKTLLARWTITEDIPYDNTTLGSYQWRPYAAASSNLTSVVVNPISNVSDAQSFLNVGESTCQINGNTVVYAVNFGSIKDGLGTSLGERVSYSGAADSAKLSGSDALNDTGGTINLKVSEEDRNRVEQATLDYYASQDFWVPNTVRFNVNRVRSSSDAYNYDVEITSSMEDGPIFTSTFNDPALGSGSGSGDIADGSVQFVVPQPGGNAVVSETLTGNAGESVVAPSTLKAGGRTGYHLVSWNTVADGSGDPVTLGSRVTLERGQKMLYAQLTVNQYDVTFDGNGATGGSTAALTGKNYGSSVTLPANGFTKTGYTFTGWNTKADGTGTAYAAGSSFTIPASDTTLYAQWKINTHGVLLNGGTPCEGDGGAGAAFAVPLGDYDYGSSVTITEAQILEAAATNSRFKIGVGWKLEGLKVLGTGETKTLPWLFTMPDNQVNVCAITSEIPDVVTEGPKPDGYVTVTFDKGAHGTLSGDVEVYVNPNKTVTLTAPTVNPVAGWSHNGWSDNFTNRTFATDTTITAQYKVNQYNVTFNGNGNSGGSTAALTDKDYGSTVTLTANGFTKTGYTFKGWNTKADGSGTAYADKASFTVPAGNTTLFAQWKDDKNNNGQADDAEKFTVIFKDGGSVLKTVPNLD